MQSGIIAFGYHDQSAPRHWNIKRDLESEGKEVLECHTTRKGFIGKYRDLWKQYRRLKGKADTVLVTFPGHFLMPLAWALTRLPRKKLIFDAFISLYDTNVCDRTLVSRFHPKAWLYHFVDVLGCALADEIWIDTEAHKKFFVDRFHLNPNKVHVVYVRTRTDIFTPKTQTTTTYNLQPTTSSSSNNQTMEILFVGTYIPLQGIEHILQAAAILQSSHPDIHFTLIGKGQTRPQMEELAKELKPTNVTFENPIPLEQIPDRIREADLCLGIFGTSDKAHRVIPHKVYDAVACGVPILTADTPAIHEQFTDGKEVILCNAGDAEDIATKITDLREKKM